MLEISELTQKTSKQEIDQYNEEITENVTETKVPPKLWRDKKRLYPPFRRKGKEVILPKYDKAQEIGKKLTSEPRKFRLSVCLQKKQFPLACSNIPLILDENTFEFEQSDLRYLPSGCDHGNEIPSIYGLDDVPCMGPISDQDYKSCRITRETISANDVCQDVVSVDVDKSNDASVSGDKLNSHYYMTVCGESIDYVICGSAEKLTFADSEDEASRETVGEEDYFDIRNGEYESFKFTSEPKLESEVVSKSEFFQDPLVSHRLVIPYKEMPVSRYCIGGSLNDSLETKFLAKRPDSPARDIPEERFDVLTRIAEVTRRAEIHNVKYALRRSKEWMAEMTTLDSLSSVKLGTSEEPLTTFLKVLLDDVTLSLTVGESENDLSLTLATIWAITEFVMTETGSNATQSVTITNLRAVPKSKRSLSQNLTLLKTTSSQRTSDIGYTPRGSDNHYLHRALPWAHLCAAHAEGLSKGYDNVRSYIDQVTLDSELNRPRAPYLLDIYCTHLKEM